MLIYIVLDIIIIFLAKIFLNKRIKIKNIYLDGNNLFYIICGLILIFISAFRGDFTTDYKGYEENFRIFSNYSLNKILNRPLYSNPENGFVILLYIIGCLTNKAIYVFIISSIIVVHCNLRELKKEKNIYPLLAIFLFLEAGIYYTSFNFMRQAIACSIAILGSDFLYKRKLIPYTIVIVFASFFHTSILILIPFYFLSNIKINKRNIMIYLGILSLLLVFQEKIMFIIHKYHWTWYDISMNKGYSWKNIIMAMFISITSIILFLAEKKDNMNTNLKYGNNEENHKYNVWLIATLLYLLFQLSGLTFNYGQRFSLPFMTYSICFFGIQIEKIKNKRIFEILIIALLISYGLITRLAIPYYFIWNR